MIPTRACMCECISNDFLFCLNKVTRCHWGALDMKDELKTQNINIGADCYRNSEIEIAFKLTIQRYHCAHTET